MPDQFNFKPWISPLLFSLSSMKHKKREIQNYYYKIYLVPCTESTMRKTCLERVQHHGQIHTHKIKTSVLFENKKNMEKCKSYWNPKWYFASVYIRISGYPFYKVKTSIIFFKDFVAVSKDFPRKTFHRFLMQKVSVLKTYLQKWHYQISFENVNAFP